MIINKNHFTLLEMLVVMLLLSVGVIVTGVKVQQAFEEQRFFSEAQQVAGRLQMAQDLMLILDTDVQAHLSIDDTSRQLVLSLNVEKPLSPAWVRLVETPIKLSAIQSFHFKNRDDRQQDGQLQLSFSFGQMSQGILKLYSRRGTRVKENKREFSIYLPGYPSPIGQGKASAVRGRRKKDSKELYPIEVYEKLYKDTEKAIKTPSKK